MSETVTATSTAHQSASALLHVHHAPSKAIGELEQRTEVLILSPNSAGKPPCRLARLVQQVLDPRAGRLVLLASAPGVSVRACTARRGAQAAHRKR